MASGTAARNAIVAARKIVFNDLVIFKTSIQEKGALSLIQKLGRDCFAIVRNDKLRIFAVIARSDSDEAIWRKNNQIT
jgi:hypothetical protein